MCRETHSTSVQVVGIISLLGWSYNKNYFSSGQFWTNKIKPKSKYISISNILHLLGAPVSIAHVGTIWDSLVVISPSICKFFIVSDFCLIVDSHFHPSRALTRSQEVSNPLTWTYFCKWIFQLCKLNILELL